MSLDPRLARAAATGITTITPLSGDPKRFFKLRFLFRVPTQMKQAAILTLGFTQPRLVQTTMPAHARQHRVDGCHPR